MLTGKHPDSKGLCHTHTNAKMNATKSFQHIHMRMPIVGQLTTFLHTHSHAQMKAVSAELSTDTHASKTEGRTDVSHTHTHTRTHTPKKNCRQGRTFPHPCTGEHNGTKELYHTHTHAKMKAVKSFSTYACARENVDSEQLSRIHTLR